MKTAPLVFALSVLLLLNHDAFCEAVGLKVEDTGGEPKDRKIVVTSPGVFKIEIWQASGGGMNRVYSLTSDPEAKTNLTREASGLLEIGWHCRHYNGPDREDCCPHHILKRAPRLKTGEMVRQKCSDGCASWPSTNKAEIARIRKDPTVMGTVNIIEQSPARVRIRAKARFNWWAIYVHETHATVTYTIYPTGRIVARVRVQNPGDRTLRFSTEYGPHLMLGADGKNAEADLNFTWHTPKLGKTQKLGAPSEELVMASSDKVKTAFLITIPPECQKLFSRHMRHNGRGIGWDRAGYGSSNVDMPPGYDNTWTCMIQMATPGTDVAPGFATAKEALPYAIQYREPAKIEGAQLVKDDKGDLNKDGYNESEGCHVLKGPGPLKFTYEKRKGAGFAPTFKVLGWKGDAPKTVKVDGKEVPAAAGVVDGNLILQVLATISGDKVKIEIGD